jgi:hypothetical protein
MAQPQVRSRRIRHEAADGLSVAALSLGASVGVTFRPLGAVAVASVSDDARHHLPVMLTEIVALLAPALQPVESGPPVIVDCTLGLGGHAEALLAACPDAVLIGLDRDPDALALAGKRLAPFGDRVQLVEAVYDELPEVLDRLGRRKVQGRPVGPGASPRCRSMIPGAVSLTRRMLHWTCGWAVRN